MSQRRGRVVLDALIAAAWLTSVGAVMIHERGYVWLGGGINPVSALRATLDASEQWFGIYYKGHKIGFAQTLVVPQELDGMPGVAMTDRGRLSFTLLGVPQQLDLSAWAFLDADWRLQRFRAEVQSDTYRLQWSGKRSGDSLLVEVSTGETRSTLRLRDGGGLLVVGLSPWSAFRRLRVGQWGSVKVLNPLALTPEEIYFNVRGQERLGDREALVVETDFRGMTTTSWVTADGEVLKEESPLGWELIREDRHSAREMNPGAATFDLLSTLAVPIDRPIADPVRVRRAVWLMEGVRSGDLALERPWQRVLRADELLRYAFERPSGNWCVLELSRPTSLRNEEKAPAFLESHRRATRYVQADDARIRSQALEIAGEIRDPWQQVVALNQWVHRSLAKQLTVGLPSAVDVLTQKVGDCHEHTVLFTALARSLGLPTRMVAGLVYYDDRLYYHAWPEVWLGGWVPTDPTLGELLADATHLGLIEAEDEQLMGLGQFIGQVRVRVLDLEEDAPAQ